MDFWVLWLTRPFTEPYTECRHMKDPQLRHLLLNEPTYHYADVKRLLCSGSNYCIIDRIQLLYYADESYPVCCLSNWSSQKWKGISIYLLQIGLIFWRGQRRSYIPDWSL